MECNSVWNHSCDFIFKRAPNAGLIWNCTYNQNCTTRCSITTLLHLFWNRKIQSLNTIFFSLYKYLTDLVYWAGLRKISKGFSHISTNWLISLDKPKFNWTFLVKLSPWLGKRCDSKRKMVRFANKSHRWEPITLKTSQAISKWM